MILNIDLFSIVNIYLSHRDITELSAVSKQLEQVCTSHYLWSVLLKRDFSYIQFDNSSIDHYKIQLRYKHIRKIICERLIALQKALDSRTTNVSIHDIFVLLPVDVMKNITVDVAKNLEFTYRYMMHDKKLRTVFYPKLDALYTIIDSNIHRSMGTDTIEKEISTPSMMFYGYEKCRTFPFDLVRASYLHHTAGMISTDIDTYVCLMIIRHCNI